MEIMFDCDKSHFSDIMGTGARLGGLNRERRWVLVNKWRKLVSFKEFCGDGEKRKGMFAGLLCKVQGRDAFFLKEDRITNPKNLSCISYGFSNYQCMADFVHSCCLFQLTGGFFFFLQKS